MERVKLSSESGGSLHEEEKPELCPNGHANWRVVECCGPISGKDMDIIECSRCGKQLCDVCNFDDEYY